MKINLYLYDAYTYNVYGMQVMHYSYRVKMDVMNAVLKAFQLAEKMDACFLQILQYETEQYCKGTAGARFEYLWPQSLQSAIKMLEDQGYQDAI